jgi:hypothetical protein
MMNASALKQNEMKEDQRQMKASRILAQLEGQLLRAQEWKQKRTAALVPAIKACGSRHETKQQSPEKELHARTETTPTLVVTIRNKGGGARQFSQTAKHSRKTAATTTKIYVVQI